MLLPEEPCSLCGDAEPTTQARWATSQGPQTAHFCDACRGEWWAAYKHTPAGETATFLPVGVLEIES